MIEKIDHDQSFVVQDEREAFVPEFSSLQRQRILGWLFVLPVGLLMVALIRIKFRIRVQNHRAIRKKFREIMKRKKPVILCPNHLTLADSVVVMWALAPLRDYFFSYRRFCWNIPAIENYTTKPSWRLITYLGKCIPIDRYGTKDHMNEVLKKLIFLLRMGDICMIFPEGTRSRTGRVNIENTTYGVGTILQEVPECEVLCIYQRGLGQASFSDFPKKNEQIYLDLDLTRPVSSHEGKRAARDVSLQIVSRLKSMEERFLSQYGTSFNR